MCETKLAVQEHSIASFGVKKNRGNLTQHGTAIAHPSIYLLNRLGVCVSLRNNGVHGSIGSLLFPPSSFVRSWNVVKH